MKLHFPGDHCLYVYIHLTCVQCIQIVLTEAKQQSLKGIDILKRIKKVEITIVKKKKKKKDPAVAYVAHIAVGLQYVV